MGLSVYPISYIKGKKVEKKTVDNVLNAFCYNTENSNPTFDAIKKVYNEEMDLYLIGITHYGMSWDYFGTTFKIRQYL